MEKAGGACAVPLVFIQFFRIVESDATKPYRGFLGEVEVLKESFRIKSIQGDSAGSGQRGAGFASTTTCSWECFRPTG